MKEKKNIKKDEKIFKDVNEVSEVDSLRSELKECQEENLRLVTEKIKMAKDLIARLNSVQYEMDFLKNIIKKLL